MAASNVTLYGVIDEAVTVTKHKGESAVVKLDNGIYAGSRFGLRGVEDLATATPSALFSNKDSTLMTEAKLMEAKHSAAKLFCRLKATGANSLWPSRRFVV